VLRDCIFRSSLEVFLQLFCCKSTLVGEDLLCAPLEYIEEDYVRRATAQKVLDTLPPDMDFESVMPASHLPRIDACKHAYAEHLATRGLPEPVTGRPIWDSGQNASRSVAMHPHAPTMLPRATLYSGTLKRPATCEEHALLQGVVIARTDATPCWGFPDYVSIAGRVVLPVIGIGRRRPKTK